MHVHTQVSLDFTPRLVYPERTFSAYFTGSNVIVAGTAIFSAQDPDKVIAYLKASVDSAMTSKS